MSCTGAPVSDTQPPTSTDTSREEPVSVPLDADLASRCEHSVFATCETTLPLPAEVATVMEFLDPNADIPGRCDASDLDEIPAIMLPDDPDAYPVLVRIAGAGFEGTCSSCGESVPPYGATTFGVKVMVPTDLRLSTAHSFVSSVNHPWRVVSGGCGEACAHNCLSHYLEFEPSTCMVGRAEGIGVATDVKDPPIAELLIQRVDGAGRFHDCCSLPCDGD